MSFTLNYMAASINKYVPQPCLQTVRQTYIALVWFFTRVAPHVDNQHVLSLEGSLLPGAAPPPTNKLLLVTVNVIVVDVLARQV